MEVRFGQYFRINCDLASYSSELLAGLRIRYSTGLLAAAGAIGGGCGSPHSK
jgi:hypothetical protein